MSLSKDTFAHMGKSYQEKVTQALLVDFVFAEQMADVIDPRFFELLYLQEIVRSFYDHKKKYKTYPSIDLMEIMITKSDDHDEIIKSQTAEFLSRVRETPLNGDTGFIQASSLDFCRRQTLLSAMTVAIQKIEESDFDSVSFLIKEALNKGVNRDAGHEYSTSLDARCAKSERKPIPTGWSSIDKELNGGWERGTISTFIAPTGAGKSMFLVNVGAAAITNGYNVLYVTCEMAEWKIALRFDSYYSGIAINDVPANKPTVSAAMTSYVKGRLFIKEFPTKTASVQTIRSYVQRLNATKGFAPDFIIVDYADLLRATRGFGEKRHELEAVYEELRALAQELNIVMVTADQTNRSGLDMEVVTIAQIGESYAKATVCDLIFTISRRMEDKQSNSGRLFIAKSRLGRDGVVYPFLLNTATVKVTMLKMGEDPIATFIENNKNLKQIMAEKLSKLPQKRQ